MQPITGFIVHVARFVARRHPIAYRPRLVLVPLTLIAVMATACDQTDPQGLTPLPLPMATEIVTPTAAATHKPAGDTGAPSATMPSDGAVSRAPFLSDRTANALGLLERGVEDPSVLAAVAAPAHEPAHLVPTAAPGVAPAATVEAPALGDGPSSGLNARAAGLLRAMNEARNAHGLSPFSLAADLSLIAHTRSADMSAEGYFAHVSPTGESWLSLLAASGIRVRGGGENLARVSGDEVTSVAIAIEHLMESATHRANILNASFSEVGVAAVTDTDGVTVFTTIFATR